MGDLQGQNRREEIEAITAQLSGRKDINKELAEIRNILNLAAECLDEDELDRSFVDRFIKQILVYPEEGGMRLGIELNAGDKVVKNLIKAVGRTGQTSKVMMDIILAVYVIEFVIKLIRFTIGIVFRRDSTGGS